MAGSNFILGGAWRVRGDLERATQLLEETLTMYREIDNLRFRRCKAYGATHEGRAVVGLRTLFTKGSL
jgi:hypothetical protein